MAFYHLLEDQKLGVSVSSEGLISELACSFGGPVFGPLDDFVRFMSSISLCYV